MKTITQKNLEETKKALPPLIQKSATYKLIVPAKVEEKIRYLQRRYPSTEWSGVLFTTHSGSFENGDLVITCHDIYPMDLGTSTFTQYNMDETVASYIADNIELFDCDLQLVHSHHSMQAWFSGTDINTLREEGNERNCFVSLIVNNEGTYCAAVTRKIQSKAEVTTKPLGTSYQFFGEGTVITEEDSSPAVTQVVDKEYIEYYMLDVERETVDNPLEYLDTRFEEIEKKKTEEKKSQIVTSYSTGNYWGDYKDDWSFSTWMSNKQDKPKVKEQFLFDDKTMKEMEVSQEATVSVEEMHKCIVKMLTCSLLINVEKFNMDSWIKQHMKAKYDELFAAPGTFDEWSEFIVEFLISHYVDPSILEEDVYDFDVFQSTVAEAMYSELSTYQGVNTYIDGYLDVISRYII